MFIASSPVTGIIQGMIDSIVGGMGGGDPLVFHAVSPDPSSFEIKGVLTGVGDLTEARTGSLYHFDHEFVSREFKTTVPAYFGGRVVENLTTQSGDFEHVDWGKGNGAITSGVTDPNGGTTAYTFTASGGANARLTQFNIMNTGGVQCASVWIKRRTGSGLIRIIRGDGALETVPVTSSWARYANTPTTTASGNDFDLWIITSGDAIDVWHPQLEEVAGQSNQAPGAYIATEAAAVQRVYGNENGNSVSSNIVSESIGSELASPVWLVGQKALTNSQIRSFNLADAEWTKSNMTATLDADGMRGDADGATELTATAANATAIANVITDASDDQLTRWHIKRKTGTGVIEITVDGGSTWQDVTTEVDSTAGFNECLEDQAALANPQIGIRIVTDTDAVYVGNSEAHLGDLATEVRQAGAIFTEGSTITTNATDLSFDDANHDDSSGLWVCDFRNAGINAPNGGLLGLGVSGRFITMSSTTSFRSDDGPNVAVGPAVTLNADDTEYLNLLAYGDSLMRMRTDSAWGTAVTYDGEFNNANSKIKVLTDNGTASAPPATLLIREIKRYQQSYTAAIAKAEELSP